VRAFLSRHERRRSFSSRALQLSRHGSKPGIKRRPRMAAFFAEGALKKLNLPKVDAKTFVAGFGLAMCLMLAQGEAAMAASKSQRCESYARNAARSAPTRGGPARGALVGAGIGSFSANAGRARLSGPEWA
jgi:hypothetical protein